MAAMAAAASRAVVAAVCALCLRTSAGAGFCLPKFQDACQGNGMRLESVAGAESPFYGINTGPYATAVATLPGECPGTSSPQAVDWDGDGDLDLIFAGSFDGTISYYERLPNSSLRPRLGPDSPFHGIHAEPGRSLVPHAADWDGDGDLDLILAGARPGRLSYYERLADSSLRPREGPELNPFHGIDLGVDGQPVPQAVDWDGDGDLDLILSGAHNGSLLSYERLPDFSLRPLGSFLGIQAGCGHSQIVDWDGDGDLDLLIGINGTVSYFERLQDSSLRPRQGRSINPFHGVHFGGFLCAHPQAVDWDGDGHLDLLVGTSATVRTEVMDGGLRLFYFRGLRDSGLRPRDGLGLNPFYGIQGFIQAADWDGDGDLDLILLHSDWDSGFSLSYFERLPDSGLRPREGPGLNPFHGLRLGGNFPLAVDWDGDGDLDLILLHSDSDLSLSYFERLPDSSLRPRERPELNHLMHFPSSGIVMGCGFRGVPHAADWDGDGDVDLLFGTGGAAGGAVVYFERLANSSLRLRQGPDLDPFHNISFERWGHGLVIPHAVDWDGDGDLDLILTGASDGSVGYLERLADSSLRPREGPENPFHGVRLSNWMAIPVAVDWDGDGDRDVLFSSGDPSYFEQGQCDVLPLCGERGLCDHATGRCHCLSGYSGSDCYACSAGFHRSARELGHELECRPCGSGQTSAGGRDARCRVRLEILLACAAVSLTVCWLCWQRCQRHSVERALRQAVKERGMEEMRSTMDRGRALGVRKDVLMEAEDVFNMCERKYIDHRFLIDAIRDGHLKLVKGSWLLAQTDRPRFKRQQELPPAAFWTAEELLAQQRFVLWIAVSYCWLHPVHPDPNGEHFKTLCHAIRLRMGVEGFGRVENVAVFLDYCSLAQHGERGALSDPEVGAERTAEEAESFGRGLQMVNVLYAHQLIEVWMMKWVPEGEPRKYMLRGWPFFEQAVAALIKDGARLIDLDPSAQGADCWAGLSQGVATSRKPPMLPDHFEEEIRKKTFTNGKTDADLVVRKYGETFEHVVGEAPTLWFSQLDWADEEAREVARLLPRCRSLRELIVRSNAIGAQGALALAAAAKGCPSLQGMDLSDNPIDEGWTEAIFREWEGSGKARERLTLSARRPDGHFVALDAPTTPLLDGPAP